jgi:23S rRNA (adenine2030-N6)-methyltransferase
MLSYRHIFHAGNIGDVVKHTALIFCLEYMGRKEKACLCIDTHAGAGMYTLNTGCAAQNREWESGIGLLRQERQQDLPPMIARYLDITGTDPYPGSPVIMKKLLRPQDHLRCFELHPADFAALYALLGTSPNIRIMRKDGFTELNALLPPPSRRGCIFMDPPYESKTDYQTVPVVLAKALRRFPAGLYIIWYPLLDRAKGPAEFSKTLLDLYRGNRCRLELYSAQRSGAGSMYGSGLIIYNPPWTLKTALEDSLPVLASLLGGNQNFWRLDWNVQP